MMAGELLLKIILLPIAGFVYSKAATPPNPPPTREERVRYGEGSDLLVTVRGPWMRRLTIVRVHLLSISIMSILIPVLFTICS